MDKYLWGPAARRGPAACWRIVVLAGLPAAAALAAPGDMNCDGAINPGDIPLFVEAQLQPGGFAGCDINRADMNGDGFVDGRDVQPFASALLSPSCPPPLTLCGGMCVDITYNNGHCGGCGIICSIDQSCVGGICEASQPCTDCTLP